MRRGSLGAVGSSEGDRGGVNGLCVWGGGGGAVETKKKERRGRGKTGKKQKGEGRVGHSGGSMNYEPLYKIRMIKYTLGLTLQEVCSKTIKLCLCMLSQCNCGIHSPITLALCVQHKLTKCASNIGSIAGSSMHSLRSHLSTVHSPEPAWTDINQRGL